jgi:hypothetical protein
VGAQPDCLAALARFLESRPGRSAEDGRREARALVRDCLLAGRTLDSLDFREDRALAELLAEELSPRWLACLGHIRRLWPSPAPRDSEWDALAESARGAARGEDPALTFWQCLCLAESPACPDELRRQARRRMKQLDPDLHAQFMRHAPPA